MLWHLKHPVIADDRNTSGNRWLDAPLANSALERLKGGQFRKRAGAIAGVGFDEMDESAIVKPQRKVANALYLRGLQFLEHACDQLRVSVGQLRLCLIPDQGPFHDSLHGWVSRRGIIAFRPEDVQRPGEDSAARKIFCAASFEPSYRAIWSRLQRAQ